MGQFIKGDVVVINFPFSDLSGTKRRPALVVADLADDDIILCQITSRAKTDRYSIRLEASDFTDGNLTTPSVVRPNKIFTADKNIILYTACKINDQKINEVIDAIVNIVGWEQGNKFPILEFDPDRDALIRPERLLKPLDISERAVVCFFADAIEKVLSDFPHEIVAHLRGEGLTVPVYQLNYNGEKINLAQAIVGAPWAAGHIEEMTAYGCRKYMVCGGCGVLQSDIAVGHLIIPAYAIRDEGTSYHYVSPSREIAMSKYAIETIESVLNQQTVPFIKGKTWTTDAFFRETPEKIARRKEEGCIAVDMEASAFMAVAQYNNVELGQIFYAGDDLSGDNWDNRGWIDKTDIREFVLKLALDICLKL